MNIKDWAEEMLIITDRLALDDFEVGTPGYQLQQSLIKGAARYRLALVEKDKETDNNTYRP